MEHITIQFQARGEWGPQIAWTNPKIMEAMRDTRFVDGASFVKRAMFIADNKELFGLERFAITLDLVDMSKKKHLRYNTQTGIFEENGRYYPLH